MGHGSYLRTALYTVTVPPDFKPQRAWHVPSGFTNGTLYMKNLAVHDARRFARLFNTKQVRLLEAGQWDHTWMIVSSCCRPSKWRESNEQPQAVKGGTP